MAFVHRVMIDHVAFLRRKAEEFREVADITPDLANRLRRMADELSREAELPEGNADEGPLVRSER
jgi:hypothetical protein